jgi:hypothetical protein
MRYSKQWMVALIIGSMYISACQKADNEPPKIVINKPVEADFGIGDYALGDTVWMDVIVTDNDELHEIKWWLIHLPSDTVYANKRHQHATKIHIKDTYYIIPNDAKAKGDYQFTVKAEDDNNNIAISTRVLRVLM